MRNFYSTDGEDIIIRNIYQDSLREKFKDARIDYGRVGAGQTGIHNACDRMWLFRETKAKVRKARQQQRDCYDEILSKEMDALFDEYNQEYESCPLSSTYRNNLIKGLEVLLWAFSHTMTRDCIRWGFEVCGQHKRVPDPSGNTISFERMMYQCYTDIKVSDMELMKAAIPELSEKVRQHGTLSWEDMNDANIPTSDTSIDRSKLNHIRHWAEIVTCDEVVERFHAEQATNDPAVLAEKKKLESARKLLAKKAEDDTKAAKKEADKKAVDDAKAEEKARVDAMPPAEKKLYKKRAAEEKKVASEAKENQKRLKLAEQKEEYERALELVQIADSK